MMETDLKTTIQHLYVIYRKKKQKKTNITIQLHTITCYIFAINIVDWNQLYLTVMVVI